MPLMNDEVLTLYKKEGPEAPIPLPRKEYYEGDFTKYKDLYPAIVDIFLFTRHGDLLLQKRGRNKRFNPGRIHTSVGGHINWGEKPEFSLTHECMEELGAPILLYTKESFSDAVKKLGSYTHKAALAYEVKNYFRDYAAANIVQTNRKPIKDRMWLYFGLYDGPAEIPDRASAGYEWINLDALKKEMKAKPEDFTAGIKIYIEEFEEEMREFIKAYCKTP